MNDGSADGRTDGRTYTQNFGWYNIIPSPLFVAGHRNGGKWLSFYQILSSYLKQYGSYGLHKILASGEIST